MHNKRRMRCPICGFLDTIKKGKRAGYSRYYCRNCRSYFTDRRAHITQKNMMPWFVRWVHGKQSIEQIAQASGYSVRKIKYYFHRTLPKCPAWEIEPQEAVNLLIDGTYFRNKLCLVLYRDGNRRRIIHQRITTGELFHELKEDLEQIQRHGVSIRSVTCDGKPNILKSVRESCSDAVVQRCVAHVIREVDNQLSRRPKLPAAIELQRLTHMLTYIETPMEAELWMQAFADWRSFYKATLQQRAIDPLSGNNRYLHKTLRRAYSHVSKALPDLFSYTHDKQIPRTTNSLESYFGHLKDHLRLHRGLSKQNFAHFLKWYTYLHKHYGQEVRK